MGQIHNLAKPYIYLWGKAITWPSHILDFWKILIFGPQNNQHFLKNPFSYSTSGHSHKAKMLVYGSSNQDLFKENRTLAGKLQSIRHFFNEHPIFHIEPSGGCLQGIYPPPQASGDALAFLPGVFSPPKLTFFIVLMKKYVYFPN